MLYRAMIFFLSVLMLLSSSCNINMTKMKFPFGIAFTFRQFQMLYASSSFCLFILIDLRLGSRSQGKRRYALTSLRLKTFLCWKNRKECVLSMTISLFVRWHASCWIIIYVCVRQEGSFLWYLKLAVKVDSSGSCQFPSTNAYLLPLFLSFNGYR